MCDHELLGEEYPNSDKIQLVLLVILVIVWIVDSFFLKILIFTSVSVFIRIGSSLILSVVGGFLIFRSHELVLEAEEPVLVDWGVYSISRHPMYLGSMLIELGIAVSTLSVSALVVWLVIFFFYNRFAEYEERSLISLLGIEYERYLKKVRRWGLV